MNTLIASNKTLENFDVLSSRIAQNSYENVHKILRTFETARPSWRRYVSSYFILLTSFFSLKMSQLRTNSEVSQLK